MLFLKRLLVLVLLASASFAARPFPQEGSDLAPDTNAHFGTLPNGLRYVIYPNREPKNRVSMRLLVQAGSLNETEDQRGLAHFLEHLAFNGSTHYAPGTLVEFFQRMGMSFGGDTNASTSFDRTLYLLELPNTKSETLAEGFRVFADYAGGLLLEPASIEKERGIVLSEKRVRDSVGFRTFVAQFDFLLRGTLLPKRIPIGETDIIEHADRARFLDFYNAWYRPDAMAVIVVGDIDPAQIEKGIVATFSPIAARAPARPEPDRGRVTPARGVRVMYHPESEAPATTLSVSLLTPYSHEPDTKLLRLSRLPRTLATEIINRRLSILAKKENAPFVEGRSGVHEAFDTFREASIDVTCKADQWQPALAVADQELRRALQFGFQPGELHEVVANFVNELDQAVKTAPTRHSNDLADELAESLNDREVYTSPADDLALLRPALEKITVNDCLAALRNAWSSDDRNVLVAGNAVITPPSGGTAESVIAEAYKKAHETPIAAPTAENEAKWGYTQFGPEGRVAKREHLDDLEIELITFENGVRLNLKKTPFEAGVIRVSLRAGDGTMTQPPSQRGLAALAGATFDAGGLGKHSVDDLQRILAGKNVAAQFGGASDAFVVRSSTTPGDLLLDLQLLAAKLTDPGFRPESLRQVRKGIDQLYLSFEHTANGPMATEVANLLANGDPRFGLPSKDALLSLTLDDVRQWVAPQLAHGPLEIAIVGDIDLDATVQAVAKTLGALPKRETKPAFVDLRRVTFPPKPFNKSYTISSEIPKGLIAVYWPTTDESDIHRTRRLNILAGILSDRLRATIREKLGGTYSPSATSFTSDTFPGYGYISASVDVEPAMAEKIINAVIELADDLAEHGVTQDELTRAKEPLLTAVRQSVRDNGYWLGSVLARAQEKPEVLDWARSRMTDLESTKVEEISALAKEYLPKTRASHVVILPNSSQAAAATKAP
jgi:zinc protease